MSIASILRPRILVAFAVAMILSASAYGFAAANTVGVSNAGDGTGAISGYTVGSPTYALNATNPDTLDSADFTITPVSSVIQPSTVKVQLSSGGTWYDAVHGTGTAWSVAFSDAPTVTSATSFRVVAAD